MPATSQQQQKLFGLALAFKRGEVPASEVSDEIKAIADRMSEKDIEDFASTKHKGLPKMKEQLRKIVREMIREKTISEMNETSVNEVQYKDAVAKFNDELIKHPMVKKVAQHYKKTPAEIVKVLQQRLSTKGNRGGDTKEVSIDFKDTDSGITIKHKKSFNESVVTESASPEAMGIAALTGTRKDAVQAFIDKHNLDGTKLLKSMKTANLRGRLNFVTALVGNDGNPNQRLTIKLHQKKSNEEVVNETKFIAFWNNKQHEIDGKDLWDAKQKAITMLKVPKSKVGLLAVVSAESQKRQDFKFN